MGALRLVLALSVALWHAGGISGNALIAGEIAVQTFYIISGFVIALVLNERYVGPGGVPRFYRNRALRIFGMYLGVLILAVLVDAIAFAKSGTGVFAAWSAAWPRLDGSTVSFLIAANLIAFGQDI